MLSAPPVFGDAGAPMSSVDWQKTESSVATVLSGEQASPAAAQAPRKVQLDARGCAGGKPKAKPGLQDEDVSKGAFEYAQHSNMQRALNQPRTNRHPRVCTHPQSMKSR